MDLMKARFLLENLLERVETLDDGSKQLSGKLTDKELEALNFALTLFDSSDPTQASATKPSVEMPPLPDFQEPILKHEGALSEEGIDDNAEETVKEIELDTTVFSLLPAPPNIRLCLDFGTAMSKATLVVDIDEDNEEIEVLKLGVPSDQEEISEVMLISSVFIDDDGLLWFGKDAIEESSRLPESSNRLQLDNIKRYLSEEGLTNKVTDRFNPTDIDISYGDLILAYLMYLTWCVNHGLENLDKNYARNIPRRFAMPCLKDLAATEAEHRLRKYIGEAQVLADTFFSTLKDGIPLETFIQAVEKIRSENRDYPFVTEKISEPLGVAGSLLGPDTKIDMLAMVVDVGAGTTDFSLYRIAVDPERKVNTAFEVEDTNDCLTEAGNYLDQLLKSFIISKTGVKSGDPSWGNINWDLDKNIRNNKETLFNESEVIVYIRELNTDVEIQLSDFLSLPQVKKFGDNLRNMMVNIMGRINSEFPNWVVQNPARRLVVVMTGGGATLPMVRALADGTINVHGVQVPLIAAKPFPLWLEEDHPNLENDYSRIAVALGGARKKIIQSNGTMSTTSSDGKKPTLGTDFTTSR